MSCNRIVSEKSYLFGGKRWTYWEIKKKKSEGHEIKAKEREFSHIPNPINAQDTI